MQLFIQGTELHTLQVLGTETLQDVKVREMYTYSFHHCVLYILNFGPSIEQQEICSTRAYNIFEFSPGQLNYFEHFKVLCV